MSYSLNIAGKTDKGRSRQNNEDTFVVEPDLGFMLVADGMGGHANGEVASQLASTLCTEQLKRSLQTGHVPIFVHVPKNPSLDPRSLLLGDCVKFSNQAVFEAGQSNPANHNMGTTLVAALWLDDKLAIAHVGDSRLYIVHDKKLIQCTVDHSFVQEQIDKGFMKPEDAEKSDFKNMLTRSVGVHEDVSVDVQEKKLDAGDYILLCSDGLTKMMPHEEIEKAFSVNEIPEKIVEDLIRRANEAGGGDNITVVVAKVEGSNSSWGSLTDRVKSIFKKAVRN
jgi:protein phosphatase